MSVWLFFKVLGDLSLYFSVIAAFPSLFPHPFSFLWPMLLCSAGVGIGSTLACWGKGRSRFLALLLPAACSLLCGSLIDLLILIPPMLYAAAIIIRNEMAVEYFDYRTFFLRSLAGWSFFFALLAMLCYIESFSKSGILTLAYEQTLRYGLLFGLNGVVLLRLLRMGADSQSGDRAMNRGQLIAVMGGTSALLIGFAAAERYLAEQSMNLLQFLWQALWVILLVPVHLIAQLLGLLIPDGGHEPPDPTESSTYPTVSVDPPPMEEPIIQTPPPAEETYPWWMAIAVLAVLVTILICMLLILRKRSAVRSSETATGRIAPEPKQTKPSRRSNRGKIRHYYREFLRSEKKKGMKLRKDQTSQDILDAAAKDTDHHAAAQLREAYLAARYDEAHEITPEQVTAARDALNRTRKS